MVDQPLRLDHQIVVQKSDNIVVGQLHLRIDRKARRSHVNNRADYDAEKSCSAPGLDQLAIYQVFKIVNIVSVFAVLHYGVFVTLLGEKPVRYNIEITL